MKNTIMSVMGAALLATGAAHADQPIELNNVYPLNQEYFQLSESMYYTQDNRGYFEVVEGPFEEGPARCVGSGFGFRDGTNSIDGICIFGEGEDTFTMRWKSGEKGEANTWSIVAGTGRYDGMTGEGIATTAVEVMYKAMPLRQSHILGRVDIPKTQ